MLRWWRIKTEEKIELAQADSPAVGKEVPGQSTPGTGAEAANWAATGATSVFGSVAMVPVAAVGLQNGIVSEITNRRGDSPVIQCSLTVARRELRSPSLRYLC